MSNKFSMTIANSGSHNRIKDCDLSTATLTTLNWFHMKPIYFHEVVPGEDVDIDISGQMQMLALNKPMFSNIRCMVRSFFVPYRTIFSHWNAFITDTRERNRKYNSVPQFPIIDFLRKFIMDETLVTKTKVMLLTPLDSYDFIVRDLDEDMFPDLETNEAYGCVFTPKGRRFYDILVGLGYNFNFGYTYDPNAINTEWRTVNFGNVSALNLMAYGKIVCDWFTLPSYQDKINTIGAILETMSEQYGVAETVINHAFMLLNYCVDLHYADDLFVSAWDNPIAPNNAGDAYARIKLVDITNNSAQSNDASRSVVRNYSEGTPGSQTLYGVTNGTPVLTTGEQAVNGNNATKNVTQYILNALQKLSSFARRNQLVGYRPLDRYLARFGKKLSSEQLIRSWVLGEGSAFNVEINPVLSQSDTVGIASNLSIGSPLGDKAGQGFGTLKDHLHFKAQDEFGMLIVVCYVVPYVKYYQGLNPTTMRVNMTDFYQPEFDGLGCEAIPAKQLFSASMNSFIPLDPTDSGYNGNVEDSRYPQNQAFGFAPRFYAYKTNPFATVSGDFRFNSRNAGMEQWHLFRKIRDGQNTPIASALGKTFNWQHNQRFTEGSSDAIYYNRIFQQVDGENDGFILGFNFNVKADLPMKPLYDDAILNSDPDSEHQSRVTMNVGGTRLV